MKYVSPKYNNDNAEIKDVITNSFITNEEVNEETGEVTKVTVTGYLSHLLGKL